MPRPRLTPLALAAVLALAAPVAAQFPFFGGLGGQEDAEQAPAKPAEPLIAWVEAPAKALQIAQKSGKPILAYITSERCRFCEKMEKDTWSDPEVARMVDSAFVPLKMLASDYPEEMAALQIRSFPTTVLISPTGKAFAGKPGYMEPKELTELLRPVLAAANAATVK